MTTNILSPKQIAIRRTWVDKIEQLSDRFANDAKLIESEMLDEIEVSGIEALLGHLRLCGTIPEHYSHDSSEEKLYSKYTDVVIHEAYRFLGLESIVLQARSDVADVECVCQNYAFVADAKAFRLSRTAKNQKDFKVQAMDRWKHGKPFAMVVCPIYQLPTKSSQIYYQASSRSVCIFTYAHLSVLVQYANLNETSSECVLDLLQEIFITVNALNPDKNAIMYWQAINRTLLNFDPKITRLWQQEKQASVEAVDVLKQESLTKLAEERERILRLTKNQAIQEVLNASKVDKKIATIQSFYNNQLLFAQ